MKYAFLPSRPQCLPNVDSYVLNEEAFAQIERVASSLSVLSSTYYLNHDPLEERLRTMLGLFSDLLYQALSE